MNNQEAKKRILTSKEYMERDIIKKSDRSYVFNLKNNNKELFFFGTSHITDPNDPLFSEIKEAFESFNPDMVYIEGVPQKGFEYYLEKTISPLSDDAAKRRGEPAYVAKLTSYLKEKQIVDLESPEPTESYEVRLLEERGFSRKEIFQYYFRRLVAQYQRTYNEKPKSMDALIEEIRKRKAYMTTESLGWSQEEISELLDDELKIVELDNIKKYSSEVDPVPWNGKSYGRINQASDVSWKIRDEYIVDRVAEGLKNHNKIFIVYGFSHAVVLRPAMEYLMDNISPAIQTPPNIR